MTVSESILPTRGRPRHQGIRDENGRLVRLCQCGRPTRGSTGMCRSCWTRKQWPLVERACAHCQKPFVQTKRTRRKLCSPQCVRAHISAVQYEAQAKYRKPRGVCEYCGSQLKKLPGQKFAGRFCSRQCSGKSKTQRATDRRLKGKAEAAKRKAERLQKVCECCGAAFTAKTFKRRTCSSHCAYRIRYVPRSTERRFHCAECGSECVASGTGRRRFCSVACGRKAARQRTPRKHAARAKKRGLPVEYGVSRRAVFQRDKWRCQLCGCRTPKRLDGTQEPNAPSLDHIVPLSAPNSPGHVWANVQCSCHHCNMEKAATVRGQLRLCL